MKNIVKVTTKERLNLAPIMKGWAFLLLFILFPLLTAQATIYTVGKSGQTYSTISACAAKAGAGDTCLVSPGIYDERVTVTSSGTAGAPITFQAQSTCNMAIPSTCAIVRGFTLSGQSYITIEGFEITHQGMTLTGTPAADIPAGVTPDPAGYDESIYMQSSNYIHIINNNINNTQDTCIFVHGHIGQTSNNLLIQGNTIAHCGNQIYGGVGWAGAQAIAIVGNSNLIENNDISHIGHDDMDLEGNYNVYRNNNLHHNSLLDGPPGDNDHLDTMQGGANIFPEVDSGGSNYLAGDVLNILQSPASDPDNPISSALIDAGGSGYIVGDVLNVVQSGGSGATVTVAVIDPVSTVSVNAPGTGYSVGDVLTISGQGGKYATATVTAVSAGAIQSVRLTQPGYGYTASTGLATSDNGNGTDCITANPSCGSGATLNITVTKGAIGGITLTTKGNGYTTGSGLGTTGGTGSGATVNISNGITVTVASVGPSGNITGVTFKTGGQGYSYAYGLSTNYLSHGPAFIPGTTPSGSGATFNYSAVGPTQYFLDENNTYSDAPSINQHFVIFQDQALPSLGSGNIIIRYNNVSNGGAFIVNNQQVTNVDIYNNSIDNMDEATTPAWGGIGCYSYYQAPTDGYTTGATGCQIINNIDYNTVYNTAGGGGNEDQVDIYSQPGFFADYNLAYNSACGSSCLWDNDCPSKGGNVYGLGCPLSGQEAHSIKNQNPLYNNAPIFGITVKTASGSSTQIETANPNNYLFNVGDNIEYNTDGVDRVVTSVGIGSIEISPALSTASIAGDTLLDWGSSTDFNYDLSLKTGSPALGKGGALTTVVSGSGTTLVVNNANLFQDGWAGVQPDWIAVGTTSNAAQISSINYATNTITLAKAFPIAPAFGNSVWLYKDSNGRQVLSGNAPNIGAYIPPYNLTVSAAGNGMIFGSTANSPNLINCGVNPDATVCSATVNGGLPVTLTAAAVSGAVFSGWSGGTCSGTGSCTVTTNATVTATFSSSQVNGVCGAANQTYLYATTNFGSNALCKAGTPNPATVAFPSPGAVVHWTCVGAGNGLNSSCKAQRNSRTLIKLL